MSFSRAALVGVAVAVAVVAIVLIVSDQGGGERRAGSVQSPRPRPRNCPVTVPNASSPPGERASPEHHGNGRLWTALDRRGTFVVAAQSAPGYLGPDGEIAVAGVLRPNGSAGIKAPWWRGPEVRGRLRLQAQRLDARAPQVDRTIPPAGYGLTGFQATGLSLPTTGCWKVTGTVGKASLTFVTRVRSAGAGRPDYLHSHHLPTAGSRISPDTPSSTFLRRVSPGRQLVR